MAAFSISAQVVVPSPSSPTPTDLGDIGDVPEGTSAGARGGAASLAGGGLVPEVAALESPPGDLTGLTGDEERLEVSYRLQKKLVLER